MVLRFCMLWNRLTLIVKRTSNPIQTQFLKFLWGLGERFGTSFLSGVWGSAPESYSKVFVGSWGAFWEKLPERGLGQRPGGLPYYL